MTGLLRERIETTRLLLRPPVPQDAETIFAAYCQDPEVCRYMVWVPHASVETTRQFVALCIDAWESSAAFPYMLARKNDAQVLGMIEARPNDHRLNIGYVLARYTVHPNISPEPRDCWMYARQR